jgi:phage terminase small subunit
MNPKQQRFVSEYLIDCNATQAAIRAGYSAKTAKSIGQRLLTFVDVQSAIQEAREKQNKAAGLTFERALEILADIAINGERDNNKIAAIAQASKMRGWDAAQKHEISTPADYDQVKAKFDLLVERKAKEIANH